MSLENKRLSQIRGSSEIQSWRKKNFEVTSGFEVRKDACECGITALIKYITVNIAVK